MCAVSGFSLGTVSRTRVAGLLDAAHIRPVWQRGPDTVRNGVVLTPTLHRLFDQGLFTLEYARDELHVEVSPQLDDTMIRAPDDSFRLPLTSGLRVRLPAARSAWPDPSLLRHHQSETFRA
ncbi:MAG TPA: HNH endonuclease signature motif containing protein [Candidatus Dormibacteraeota bacterium]|nr:HNH endonuclease signature motif containing protein [Candidatus Dormibacteraeota bacterium]